VKVTIIKVRKRKCPICKGTRENRNPDGKVYDCSCVKKRRIK